MITYLRSLPMRLNNFIIFYNRFSFTIYWIYISLSLYIASILYIHADNNNQLTK